MTHQTDLLETRMIVNRIAPVGNVSSHQDFSTADIESTIAAFAIFLSDHLSAQHLSVCPILFLG